MKLAAPLALVAAVLLGACATVSLWMDPITQIGPGTYQITHSMGQFSPVKGVRSGVLTRAQNKCVSLNAYYVKVKEEIIPAGDLTYTLTFKCNSSPEGVDTAKPKSKKI